jgi:hypothetical protein
MIEAANTSETSVNFYQTSRHNNPEYSILHTRRRENLKSHLVWIKFVLWLNKCFIGTVFVNKMRKEIC